MDALGVLTLYDPTSLPKLQYLSGTATSNVAITIPKSKFIIVFPSSNRAYMSGSNGTAMMCPEPMLLGPNSTIIMMDGRNTRSITFNKDSISVIFSTNGDYTIAYCPV